MDKVIYLPLRPFVTQFIPPPPVADCCFRVLQWNADGVRGKKMELKEFLRTRDIHVALIQETKLREDSRTPIFPGYTSIRLDRPRGGAGGGLLALVGKHTQRKKCAISTYLCVLKMSLFQHT